MIIEIPLPLGDTDELTWFNYSFPTQFSSYRKIERVLQIQASGAEMTSRASLGSEEEMETVLQGVERGQVQSMVCFL